MSPLTDVLLALDEQFGLDWEVERERLIGDWLTGRVITITDCILTDSQRVKTEGQCGLQVHQQTRNEKEKGGEGLRWGRDGEKLEDRVMETENKEKGRQRKKIEREREICE